MLHFLSSPSCGTISNLQLGAAFFAGLAAVKIPSTSWMTKPQAKGAAFSVHQASVILDDLSDRRGWES
jgi:hypothetical protein